MAKGRAISVPVPNPGAIQNLLPVALGLALCWAWLLGTRLHTGLAARGWVTSGLSVPLWDVSFLPSQEGVHVFILQTPLHS